MRLTTLQQESTVGGCSLETTVIEVPSECKALAETMRALVDAVVAQMRSLGNRGRSVDYGKVEVEVGEKTAAVEREAHRALLGALDVDVPAVVVDGVRHSRAGRFNGSYYTLAGAVVIERTLYRSAEGPCFDAISLRAGVVGDGWLPRTARAMAQQVARVPSREAEVSAMEVGRIPYSRSSRNVSMGDETT